MKISTFSLSKSGVINFREEFYRSMSIEGYKISDSSKSLLEFDKKIKDNNGDIFCISGYPEFLIRQIIS